MTVPLMDVGPVKDISIVHTVDIHFCAIYIVTDDPGSKPYQGYVRPRNRQNYIRKN